MKRQFTLIVVVLMGMVLGLGAGVGICQVDDMPGDVPVVTGSTDLQTMNVEAFGGNYQTLVIPAAEFTPQGDVTYRYNGSGFISRTGGTQDTFWAPVLLPAGAHISLSILYLYDDNPSANVTLTWGAYGFPQAYDPYYHSFLSVTKDTDVGYTQKVFIPNTVIRYRTDLDGTGGSEATAYRLTVRLPVTNNSLRFGGVELNWKRTVSPAPATATFPDVPTSHWAFQYVEALAASGITQGYSDGTFRPTNPVTRAQMATFLSRALGLHWPN